MTSFDGWFAIHNEIDSFLLARLIGPTNDELMPQYDDISFGLFLGNQSWQLDYIQIRRIPIKVPYQMPIVLINSSWACPTGYSIWPLACHPTGPGFRCAHGSCKFFRRRVVSSFRRKCLCHSDPANWLSNVSVTQGEKVKWKDCDGRF